MTDGVIAYIDGFNLYHGLRQKWGRKYLWLDLVALVASLRPRDHLVAVKYFTARVLDDPSAKSRQDTYLKALAGSHPRALQIIHGRYQRKHMTCRVCGAEWLSYEEKETDVNISTQIVADSAADAMSSALIVSADSDLSPAVRMARELRPQLFLVAAFPPLRRSAELRALMPASFTIGLGRVKAAQFPDEVTDGAMTYKRPAKWT